MWLPPDVTRPWLKSYPDEISARLDYPEAPLYRLLEDAAALYPDRIACHYYEQAVSYEQMLAEARSLAKALVDGGVEPGDRVAVLLPNLPETVASLFGIWMAGAVAVSVSPLMVAEEVNGILRATDAKVAITVDVLSPLICGDDHVPELVIMTTLADRLSQLERFGYAWVRFQKIGFSKPCVRTRVLKYQDVVGEDADEFEPRVPACDDPAFILPTGGTTGHPKLVTLSHRNLSAQANQLSHWSFARPGEETILAVLPFFHSYGLSTSLLMGTKLGATLVTHHRVKPTVVAELIEKHQPTILLAVPALLNALNTKVLRSKKRDFQSIVRVISGGAPLPKQVAEEFNDHAGAIIVEGYGLSEASPVTHAGPLDGTAVPGTIGLPLPDTDARIVDAETGKRNLPVGEVGELIVRGPQVMLGYWNDEAATQAVIKNGWLYTGDLAVCDDRGFFKIVDRKKDLIITSGFNVYPADVEEALREYPGVRDAAVVGIPDDERGELVKAILSIEKGSTFDRTDFDAFTHRKLSAHKRPRVVETTTDDLPRNFLGKVLRRELRTAADAGTAALSPAERSELPEALEEASK
ncbi:AMP-binding protein [Stratiformator vulcanicus]|nr:AMP-binding protein [Stratiformator vulcanicus]